jgi:serine/threonine protein kinase
MDSVIDHVGPDNAHRLLSSLFDEGQRPPADLPPGIARAREDGYQPLHEIGRGAGHVAWRCFDTRDDLDVVVKTIAPDGARGDAAVQMLLAESAILQSLSHPGIVRSIRTGGQGPDSYLAVHFIVGLDLASHATELGMGTGARLGLLSDALEALAHLHRNGIVHGDIKPEHFIVAEQGQPMLIDFGLASHLAEDRETGPIPSGHIGGTPPYLAPEVRDRRQHAPRTEADVYAFGMTMRAVLDGCTPGRALRRAARVADRATREDPCERYPDAGTMLAALQSARRRYPRPRTLVGAGLLAALMAGVLLALAVKPTPPAPPGVAAGPVIRTEPDGRPYGNDPFAGEPGQIAQLDPASGLLAWVTAEDALMIRPTPNTPTPLVRPLSSPVKGLDIAPGGEHIVATLHDGTAQVVAVQHEGATRIQLPYPITEAWYDPAAQSIHCWSTASGLVAQVDTTGTLLREVPLRADYIQRDPEDRQLLIAVRTAEPFETEPATFDIVRLGEGIRETVTLPQPGHVTAFDSNPTDGVLAVGTSGGRVHARMGGAWKTVDLGAPVPVSAIHSDGFAGVWGELIEVDWASETVVARCGQADVTILTMRLFVTEAAVTQLQADGITRWHRTR